MSTARGIIRVVDPPVPAAPATPAAPMAHGGGTGGALTRRAALRLRDDWAPRAAWAVGRTGRPGLVGIGLLIATAVFLFSTHLEVASEVAALRAAVASAGPASRPAARRTGPATSPRVALPARSEVPAILRQLFALAARERLAVDIGKYEVKETKGTGLVRYAVTLPVTGSYPQIRAFIDATLAAMPAVGLGDLVLERRRIGDAEVEADLRWTVYMVEGPGGTPAAAAFGAAPTERVVAPRFAEALFAPHSGYVAPPPRPPAPEPPPPPPPAPVAPPLPFTFVGRYAPGGDPPTFFLARGDRVIEAHVGDLIDGVYQLENATPGQLVFIYLPLNVRQFLGAGGSK